jgi:hypothetical protein
MGYADHQPSISATLVEVNFKDTSSPLDSTPVNVSSISGEHTLQFALFDNSRNANITYFKGYNAAAPAASDAPVMVLPIPAASKVYVTAGSTNLSGGLQTGAGTAYQTVAAASVKTATATDPSSPFLCTLGYEST